MITKIKSGLFFFPTKWANSLVDWLSGIHSVSPYLKVKNTRKANGCRSVGIDFNYQKSAEKVTNILLEKYDNTIYEVFDIPGVDENGNATEETEETEEEDEGQGTGGTGGTGETEEEDEGQGTEITDGTNHSIYVDFDLQWGPLTGHRTIKILKGSAFGEIKLYFYDFTSIATGGGDHDVIPWKFGRQDEKNGEYKGLLVPDSFIINYRTNFYARLIKLVFIFDAFGVYDYYEIYVQQGANLWDYAPIFEEYTDKAEGDIPWYSFEDGCDLDPEVTYTVGADDSVMEQLFRYGWGLDGGSASGDEPDGGGVGIPEQTPGVDEENIKSGGGGVIETEEDGESGGGASSAASGGGGSGSGSVGGSTGLEGDTTQPQETETDGDDGGDTGESDDDDYEEDQDSASSGSVGGGIGIPADDAEAGDSVEYYLVFWSCWYHGVYTQMVVPAGTTVGECSPCGCGYDVYGNLYPSWIFAVDEGDGWKYVTPDYTIKGDCQIDSNTGG